jgi:3-hydroxymyristoyl/3-hydroxydecanoyl-(acyl carrier protein) dehydratase
MYDGCLQTLRLLLLSRGWVASRRTAAFQPPVGLNQTLKCRGQVTPETKQVAYEVHLREVGFGPVKSTLAQSANGDPPALDNSEPFAVAEAVMLADGRPIVEVQNMGLTLTGVTAKNLLDLWPDPDRKAPKGRKTVIINQPRRIKGVPDRNRREAADPSRSHYGGRRDSYGSPGLDSFGVRSSPPDLGLSSELTKTGPSRASGDGGLSTQDLKDKLNAFFKEPVRESEAVDEPKADSVAGSRVSAEAGAETGSRTGPATGSFGPTSAAESPDQSAQAALAAARRSAGGTAGPAFKGAESAGEANRSGEAMKISAASAPGAFGPDGGQAPGQAAGPKADQAPGQAAGQAPARSSTGRRGGATPGDDQDFKGSAVASAKGEDSSGAAPARPTTVRRVRQTGQDSASALGQPEEPPQVTPQEPAPPTASREATRTVVGPDGAETRTIKVRAKKDDGSGSLSVRRPSRSSSEVFDKERLTQMSTGLMSQALGPLYARFDDGSFVARLPRAPFDFLDEATVKRGRVGQVTVGSQVEAVYRLAANPAERAFLLSQAGGSRPVVPYAALNEMALQPCGFLAAYMGSALSFPGPMHFRNLGGDATVLSHIDSLSGEIQTKATLTKFSVLGSMAIQHYNFSVFWNGSPIYEGQTHFGFHSPESLAKPLGLKANQTLLKALTAPAASGPSKPYPSGRAWAEGPWRMIDSVVSDTRGDGRVWGRTKVNPKAWFFQAHFPGDPVWPGSLGLEGFFQAAKVLAADIFRPGQDHASLEVSWQSPAPGITHRWLYRGQIIPFNKDVVFGLKVIGNDPAKCLLTLRGLLWVDNQVVYQVDDFTVRLQS